MKVILTPTENDRYGDIAKEMGCEVVIWKECNYIMPTLFCSLNDKENNATDENT